MKVMLFHNEHLVEEQPACGESVCSLTSFREYYQHLLDLDLQEECATTFSAAAGTEENKDVEEHEEYETDVSDEDDDSSQEDSDEDSSEESIEEDNWLLYCKSQPLWVRFWDPKKAPSSCTHLGPAQVMEVIIIDV